MPRKKKVVEEEVEQQSSSDDFSEEQRSQFVVQPEDAVNPTSPVYQIQRDRAEGKN